ncbi:UDP-2,3-diacylglucosamine diphosphatase LpxI [soil metagenome]
MTPVGLIAGAGRFPVTFAEKARECGIPVVCVAGYKLADPILKDICTEFYWMKRLSIGHISRSFRRGGVKRWTMAGKYHKHVLFQPWAWLRLLPDYRLMRLIYSHSRRDNKDDTILTGLIDEFRADGLECVSALDLCPELLVKHGVLTRRKPSAAEAKDIEFGWNLAREMGRLDIGQSVMVRNRAVMAVEAIEGTDLAIRRAGELCRGGAFTVVKVAKPNQDMRFDVPTVGRQTIESMKAAGGKVLAIEAGRTILLDAEETIAFADRCGICITALETMAT